MRIKIRGTEDRTGGLQIQPIRDILEERGHETAKDGMEGDLCIHFTRTDEKGYSVAKAGRDVYLSGRWERPWNMRGKRSGERRTKERRGTQDLCLTAQETASSRWRRSRR